MQRIVPKINCLNDKYLLSRTVSEDWESGRCLEGVSHSESLKRIQTGYQSGRQSSESPYGEGSSLKLTFVTVYRLLIPASCGLESWFLTTWTSPWAECLTILTTWQLSSPKWVIWRNPKMQAIVIYNIILEVMRHYFCFILWVTQMNHGIVWEGQTQGLEYQEVRNFGGRLGSWLSQVQSRFASWNYLILHVWVYFGALCFLLSFFLSFFLNPCVC